MSIAFIVVLVFIFAGGYYVIHWTYPKNWGRRIQGAALFLLLMYVLGGLVVFLLIPRDYTYWMSPWRHRGTFRVTDLDGNDCTVNVYTKVPFGAISIPPGIHPMIKLTASSSAGKTTLFYPTKWRFGVGKVRAAEGGVEAFMGYRGIRFQVKRKQWVITTEDVWAITSLDEAVHNSRSMATAHINVGRLLASGEDPNQRGADGLPMLHLAAKLGNADVVDALLDFKADIEALDSKGWTALHHAAYNRHSDVVKVLLEHGARANVADKEGKSPWDVARLGRIREMLKPKGRISPSDT